jgi:chromosome segregation ATPase
MEDINREEAEKAEQEAYEQKMRDRAAKEEERAAAVDAMSWALTDFDAQLATLNEEIEYLIQLNNNPDIDPETKQENIASISSFREEYFDISDQRAAKETELVGLQDQQNEERANEAVADEAEWQQKEDNRHFDEWYSEASSEFLRLGTKMTELDAKLEDYNGRIELANQEGRFDDAEKYQKFVDLYARQ